MAVIEAETTRNFYFTGVTETDIIIPPQGLSFPDIMLNFYGRKIVILGP